MDRSPPAAPHPASRRRSCSRLQAGERIPEEDLHLSDQTRFQAHWEALARPLLERRLVVSPKDPRSPLGTAVPTFQCYFMRVIHAAMEH
jgi:hypothetical protein